MRVKSSRFEGKILLAHHLLLIRQAKHLNTLRASSSSVAAPFDGSSWLSLPMTDIAGSRWMLKMNRNTCKSNNCQLLRSSKDICNNKIKGVGPLSLSMASSKRTGGAINGFIAESKDAKEVENREHHMHSGICIVFQLLFASKKEWRVFISFPIRLWKKLLDSGVCTLADSELIPLITTSRNVEQLYKINT